MSLASFRSSGKPVNLPDPTERAIAIPGLRSVRCTRRSVNRAPSHVSHPEDSRPQSVAYPPAPPMRPGPTLAGRSQGEVACAEAPARQTSTAPSILDVVRDPYVSGAICRTPGHRPLRTGEPS